MTGAASGVVPYAPPGKVAARFLTSTATVRAIMGPYGSGKTSTCLIDPVMKAQTSRVQPDGWRRWKTLVVRDTFRQLEKTTIPTWVRWFPKKGEGLEWVGGEGGRPAKHTMTWEQKGSDYRLEYIVEFVGLNEQAIDTALDGFEFTSAFINAADKCAEELLTYLLGRKGRYPPTDAATGAGADWAGVSLDFNAPNTENWCYKRFIKGPLLPGEEFFRQPGGRDPEAENLTHLKGGREYYDDLALRNPPWWVARYVDNKPGYSRAGKPVYDDFDPNLNVSKTILSPVPGIPLELGLDGGGTPAVLIGQKMPNAQWRIYDEIVTPADKTTGPTRLAEYINALLATPRYRAVTEGFWLRRGDGEFAKPIVGWGDPAAFYGGDTEAGDKSWMEVVAAKTQIPIKPAPGGNELAPRHDAVRQALVRPIEGGQRGLLISPNCVVLIEGFAAGYRFRKLQLAGADRWDDKPEKNEWSHVHDAGQYLLLGGGEFMEVTGRREKRERAAAMRGREPAQEYDPYQW